MAGERIGGRMGRWAAFKAGFWGAFKRQQPALARRLCAHESVKLEAATAASPSSSGNVDVGVVARCGDCGRSWSGDVTAGLNLRLGRRAARSTTLPS